MANQQAFAGHKFFNLNSAFAPLALTSLDLSHKYYHGFQAFFGKNSILRNSHLFNYFVTFPVNFPFSRLKSCFSTLIELENET